MTASDIGTEAEKRQRALYFTERLFKQAEAKGKGFARVHIDTTRLALGLPRKDYSNGVSSGCGTVGCPDCLDGSGGDGR